MSGKILIVDDAETQRVQLRRDLESKGFAVVEGFDGINGLEVLHENRDVKMIICDVNMPRLDGLAMCKKISEDAELSKIPKLMLTTESNPTMKAQGKDAGVTAWMTKPYNSEKLLGAVAKILQRG